MTHHNCPVCGCDISGEGYEKDGITYCCKPCAEKGNCECDCGCHTNPTNIPDSGGE